ncbi:cytochrome c assembly protein [Fulvitalea axinellae]|uniref:Cytochrome c assembly protein n=1 Tax=Fulvitalea axinellae TaxID=1182444 RepID=A0AAU9CPD4_9BACT|nr:cytochrome c assembly protein [Fulvitalea axinellae]
MQLNETVGLVGRFSVYFSFALALVSAISFIISLRQSDEAKRLEWLKNARGLFYVHAVAVAVSVICVMSILFGNKFEYHYAWSHSSINLPFYYVLAGFWEGQEGSFQLWVLFDALLGLVLIKTNKSWEAPVMAIFALVQVFLISMLLGLEPFGIKIGSSPFILLRDAVPGGVFDMNPNFIPEDGTGLNPLLQNIWMVIHPPVLFLGYALALIPFAFALAGMVTGRVKEWIKPALPWTILGTAVLGAGIIMGGYWAYVTLNFGGYWAWDPVENAVLVPWLVMVGSVHMMIIARKSETALKASYILAVAGFVLILYSTFLTRSGILGNSSVHSFTDLGLSGQLLIYLLFFTFVAIGVFIAKWKLLPSTDKETSAYSGDFWIFIGITILMLSAFQVLIPTSFPVFNSIAGLFGGDLSLALPADQEAFYNKFQIWFAVGLALFSGIAQFFYWRRVKPGEIFTMISVPLVITLVITSAIILIGSVHKLSYILFLTSSVFMLVSNGRILFHMLSRSNFKLSGGAVSHIGVALMLIGVLFSSGYSKVISQNRSGMLLFGENADATAEREHMLMWINSPEKLDKYEVKYLGKRVKIEGHDKLVDRNLLLPTDIPHRAVAVKDYKVDGKTIFFQGDTVKADTDVLYCEVEYSENGKKAFTLFPQAKVNAGDMGLIPSPDIRRYWDKDIYTHVAAVADPSEEPDWTKADDFIAKQGERFFINDYVARFERVEPIRSLPGIELGQNDAAVKAIVNVFHRDRTYTLEPIFVIKNRRVARLESVVEDLGIRMIINDIDPDNGGAFTFKTSVSQEDYIIMKASSKPMINILWLGTFVLMFGFGISGVRRYKDFKAQRNKDKKRAARPLAEASV